MARKLRLEYPGAIYHIMNRGDRREPIVKELLAQMSRQMGEHHYGAERAFLNRRLYEHRASKQKRQS